MKLMLRNYLGSVAFGCLALVGCGDDAPATPERVLWGVEQMRRLKVAQAETTQTQAEPA